MICYAMVWYVVVQVTSLVCGHTIPYPIVPTVPLVSGRVGRRCLHIHTVRVYVCSIHDVMN